MKPKRKAVLDVDVIGNQNDPLTEEEAQKLHEYFQEQKKQTKEKKKFETLQESNVFNTQSK